MDLSDPARAVLPAGTAAILRVLVGADTSFTMRQLARLAGVSAPLAGDVVRRLAEHGLVLTEPAGRAILCRYNNDHLAAEPLRELIRLRARLLELLSQELAAWEIAPLHASLFGSASRGDGGTASDLDILVVRTDDLDTEQRGRWDDQLFTTGQRVRAATGNPVNWFDATVGDLARAVQGGETIVADWRRDGTPLVGDSLSVILRTVA
ncbi:MAG TPA: hypothetical protein VFD41_03780 [Actinomycetales bacterium]|nr:hypothetical protein [Actinomycetales bacterium]